MLEILLRVLMFLYFLSSCLGQLSRCGAALRIVWELCDKKGFELESISEHKHGGNLKLPVWNMQGCSC